MWPTPQEWIVIIAAVIIVLLATKLGNIGNALGSFFTGRQKKEKQQD